MIRHPALFQKGSLVTPFLICLALLFSPGSQALDIHKHGKTGIPHHHVAVSDSVMENLAALDEFQVLAETTSDASYLDLGLEFITSMPGPHRQNLAVRLIEADFLSATHRFDASVNVLENLLETYASAQAGLRLLPIYMMSGRFHESRRLCPQLRWELGVLPSLLCVAWVRGVTDDLESEISRLAYLDNRIEMKGEIRDWSREILLDLLYQAGHVEKARHLLGSMEAPDSHLIKVAVDYELLTGNGGAMGPWLDGANGDAYLVRRGIVAHLSGGTDREAKAEIERAREIVDGWRMSDLSYTRFDLALWDFLVTGQMSSACRYALLNWEHQRYVTDALLLKRCSLPRYQVSRLLDTWVSENRIQSPLLRN